jgi:hypothetical protein
LVVVVTDLVVVVLVLLDRVVVLEVADELTTLVTMRAEDVVEVPALLVVTAELALNEVEMDAKGVLIRIVVVLARNVVVLTMFAVVERVPVLVLTALFVVEVVLLDVLLVLVVALAVELFCAADCAVNSSAMHTSMRQRLNMFQLLRAPRVGR